MQNAPSSYMVAILCCCTRLSLWDLKSGVRFTFLTRNIYYKWIRIGNEIKISLTCIQEFGKLSSKSVCLKKKKRAMPTLKRNSTRRNGGKGERVESNRVASLETLTWEAWPVDVAASSLVPSRLADSRDSCCL